MTERTIFLRKEWLSPNTVPDFDGVAACISEYDDKIYETDLVFSTLDGQARYSSFITDQQSLEVVLKELRILKQVLNAFFNSLKELKDDLPEKSSKLE
jgi:hypothetical protein